MPNYCTNHLTISVPVARLQALKDALVGPADWAAPYQPASYERAPVLSLHDQLAYTAFLQTDPAVLRAEFQKHHPLRPDWMPVSLHDIEQWYWHQHGLKAKDDTPEIVPFSVVRLMPWTGFEEFQQFFPGHLNAQGWWVPNPSNDRGWRDLRHDRLGVKWPPGNITLKDDPVAPIDGRTRLIISYITPWGPLVDLSFLQPVLVEHDAKAVLIWDEEDNNCGVFWVDPSNGVYEAYEHSREEGIYVQALDEDGQEMVFSVLDETALIERVQDELTGLDFVPVIRDPQ